VLRDDGPHHPAFALSPREQERHDAARLGPGRSRRRREDIGGGELRVLVEDPALELTKRAAGLDAELVDEHASCVAEGRERLGLPTGPIQRNHQLPTQTLAVRMLDDQALELGKRLRVPTELEVRLDSLLEGGEP
jgi:hypothetical protein